MYEFVVFSIGIDCVRLRGIHLNLQLGGPMRNRVFGISKKYIQSLYAFMVIFSLGFPMMLMGVFLKRDVTFELSFIILLMILGGVIFITLFHEGRKMIQAIQGCRLEISETRLLIQREKKKELIFFDELENISVYEDRVGRVQAVLLTTVYGSITKLSHYEDLKELVGIIRSRGRVIVKRQKNDWIILGLTMTVVTGVLVLMFQSL
jgi:hypothetical protein